MRALILLVLVAALCGCGGTPAATGSPTPTRTATATATAAPTPTPSEVVDGSAEPAAALCFLTPADWQAFNYVTGAAPDVTSDAPGTAICQYASGLFLEVYTHQDSNDADATYQTILENAPFDQPQQLTLPGADKAVFDPEVTDNHAGIAVQAGKLVFTISALARDSSQSELMTLAGLVLQRAANLI
jgi:hypothetical protein